MIELLLIICGGICFVILLQSLRQRAGAYQFPFLATAVFTGFAFVQMVGLSNNPWLPAGALSKTIVMTTMCILMVYFGGKLGSRPFVSFNWEFSKSRLLIASAVLSVLGAYFFFQISRLPIELKSSQWSGIVVAYNFFARSLDYGLAIAALVYMATSSKLALGILIFDLSFYLERIFIGARRGDAAELLAFLVLALWFRRGVVVPRTLVIGAISFGVLFVYSTGDYRGGVSDRSLIDVITSIEFGKNFQEIINNGGVEMQNAAYQIASTDKNLDFDYGAFHWNSLVSNYIPAQFFGSEFKESLLISTPSLALSEYGYEFSTGSTYTGIADSFRSFWYFGMFNFLFISYVLARIYKSAVRGNTVMQLLYMLMLTNGLHAITHHTNWFIAPWIHLILFLAPALLYARVTKNNSNY